MAHNIPDKNNNALLGALPKGFYDKMSRKDNRLNALKKEKSELHDKMIAISAKLLMAADKDEKDVLKSESGKCYSRVLEIDAECTKLYNELSDMSKLYEKKIKR